MRIRFPMSAALAIGLLPAVAIGACGVSESEGDASTAGDEGGLREGSVLDVPEAEAPCAPDADLLAKVTDASIADGASTTGLCLGCARARCEQTIAKCTEDCPCQKIVGDALECYVTTRQLGCADRLANIFVTRETRQYALQLLGCVQTECRIECAVDDAGDAGDDGG